MRLVRRRRAEPFFEDSETHLTAAENERAEAELGAQLENGAATGNGADASVDAAGHIR